MHKLTYLHRYTNMSENHCTCDTAVVRIFALIKERHGHINYPIPCLNFHLHIFEMYFAAIIQISFMAAAFTSSHGLPISLRYYLGILKILYLGHLRLGLFPRTYCFHKVEVQGIALPYGWHRHILHDRTKYKLLRL